MTNEEIANTLLSNFYLDTADTNIKVTNDILRIHTLRIAIELEKAEKRGIELLASKLIKD